MVKRVAHDAAARPTSKKTKVHDEPKGVLKKAGRTQSIKAGQTVANPKPASNGKQSNNSSSKPTTQSTRFSGSEASHVAASLDVKGKAKASDQTKASATAASQPSLAKAAVEATAFEVIAGSYERLLYGLHCTVSGTGGAAQVEMQPVFQFPAHLSCVKTAAASPNGRWLATGAGDEVIKVWDLRRRKELGGLLGHEGDITSLTFSTDKYLVSTSADGTLSLFRTKDWSVLRKFKGHKGRVNHAAVHPQGRVALSVGKDRCLRMWDLLGRSTGKSSTSTKLGAEADLVRWNIDGTRLAVLLDRQVRVFSTDMTRLATLTSLSRFHDIQFAEIDGQEIFLVGCEDRKVRIYTLVEVSSDSLGKSLEDKDGDSEDENDDEPYKLQCFAELVGHANRVKAVSVTKVLNQHLATTISSDGRIQIYPLAGILTALNTTSATEIQPIQTYDTKGSRLTCLTVVGVKDDRTTRGTVDGMGDSDSEDEGSSDSDDDDDADIVDKGFDGVADGHDNEELEVDEDEDDEEEEDEDDEEEEDESEQDGVEGEVEADGDEEEWGGIDG